MNYLLDTNIIVIYGRDSNVADLIEQEHEIFSGKHNLAISVVTLGELNSLSQQLKYGERRKRKMNTLVEDVFKIDINILKVIEKYGEIDAYSQRKLEDRPLHQSARNMGKNDLWIAATASAYDMVLITTDKDFNHLDGEFIKLKYIDVSKYLRK